MKTEPKQIKALTVGSRVQMTAPNSNWVFGELGTVTWIGSDRVAVAFRDEGDDYTVLIGDFSVV